MRMVAMTSQRPEDVQARSLANRSKPRRRTRERQLHNWRYSRRSSAEVYTHAVDGHSIHPTASSIYVKLKAVSIISYASRWCN